MKYCQLLIPTKNYNNLPQFHQGNNSTLSTVFHYEEIILSVLKSIFLCSAFKMIFILPFFLLVLSIIQQQLPLHVNCKLLSQVLQELLIFSHQIQLNLKLIEVMQQDSCTPPPQLPLSLISTLDSAFKLIKTQPNPFLQTQLIIYLKGALEYKDLPQEFSANEHLSEFSSLYSYISREISSLDANQSQKFSEYLESLLKQELKIQTSQYWYPADIFLNLPSIKTKLLPEHQHKLIGLLFEEKSKDQLVNFVEQLQKKGVVSILEVNGEIKALNNKKLKKIEGVFLEILKNRPQGKDKTNIIIKNKQSIIDLIGQVIEITKDNQTVLKGMIVSGYYSHGLFDYSLKINNEDVRITMFEDPKQSFIEKIVITNGQKHELIDILLLPSLTQAHKKEGSFFDGEVKLQQNILELGASSFIPQNKYKISYSILSKKSILVRFQSLDSCFNFQFIFDPERNQYLIVKNCRNNKTYQYRQFMKSYTVIKEKETFIHYSNLEESNHHINIKKLQNHNQKEILELRSLTNAKKNQLKGQIIALQATEPVFFKNMFKKMLQGSPLPSLNNKIEPLLTEIVTLHQKYLEKQSRDQLLREILVQVNFVTIINKSETLNTIKIIELLAESEKAANSMAGKNIIAFYGNTGSGKSTTINYFLRLPLMFMTKSGIRIVTINQSELHQLSRSSLIKEQCKIGHSTVISETVFSRGYTIPEDELEEDEDYLKEVSLCDNPGFGETRGTQHEVCTQLSMDRAIDLCSSVKAIVLVVTHDSIFADRGSKLIELIYSMKAKYPRILDMEGNVFSRFFILITKNHKITTDSLQHLKANFEQAQKQLIKLENVFKNNYLELQPLKQKIRIFKCLVQMCIQEQIHFIDIEDDASKFQLIQKYAGGNTVVPKEEYKKSLQSKSVKTFISELNIFVDNWINSIFNPFLKINPKLIQDKNNWINFLKGQLDSSMLSLRELENNIKNKQNQLNEIQQNIQLNKSQLQRIMNEDYTQNEKTTIESIQPFVLQNIVIRQFMREKQELQELKEDLQRTNQQKIKQRNTLQLQFQDLSLKLKEKKEEERVNQEQMSTMTKGSVKQVIANTEYKVGEKLNIGTKGYSQEERLKIIQKNQEWISKDPTRVFEIGSANQSTFSIIHVQKKYQLMPNKDFDPNEYISSLSYQLGSYKAEISFRKCVLEGCKIHNEGKVIMLSVIKNFVKTDKQEELPFLKITHQIPNKQYNKDAIANLEAESRRISREIYDFEERIREFQNKITSAKQSISNNQKEIQTYRQQIITVDREHEEAKLKEIEEIKAETKAEKKKLMTEQKQKLVRQSEQSLLVLTNSVTSLKNSKEKKEAQILNYKEVLSKEQKQINDLIFKQQQLGFLIKDQLQKQIPQTLLEFITISESSKSQLLNIHKNGKEQQGAKQRVENFRKYREIYSQFIQELDRRIQQALSAKIE